MTESENLSQAQDFITQELQIRGADRINAITFEQTPQDRATRIHRLILFRGSEKSIFTFTEYMLLNNYGSQEWEEQMRSHVGEILTELAYE